MREEGFREGLKKQERPAEVPEYRVLGQRQAKLMQDAIAHTPQAFKEYMVDGSVVCSRCGSAVVQEEGMWPTACSHCHARM